LISGRFALGIDCLLFVEEESPLTIAFEMLFDAKSGINAVKSNASDLQELINEINDLRSQVVIFEDVAIDSGQNSIAGLLASSSELKIIVVLRDSNYIYTFKKEQTLIQTSSDLLDEIRSVSARPESGEAEKVNTK